MSDSNHTKPPKEGSVYLQSALEVVANQGQRREWRIINGLMVRENQADDGDVVCLVHPLEDVLH